MKRIISCADSGHVQNLRTDLFLPNTFRITKQLTKRKQLALAAMTLRKKNLKLQCAVTPLAGTTLQKSSIILDEYVVNHAHVVMTDSSFARFLHFV